MGKRIILVNHKTRRETEVSAKTAAKVPAETDRRAAAAARRQEGK